MQLDGAALHQHRLEGLDAQTVQRRRAVQQHRMVVDHLFENVPHLRAHALDETLGALDVVREPLLDQLAHDERLEQLQRHLLGQPTLVQLEVRADHDHRAARIIHTLAQQVLAESPLLALQHVRETLELMVARAGHRAPAPAVVDQRVAGLLQHALLVADDDLRRAQLQQPLEAVVAVDHATIQVVQVAGGEAAAIELHHRPQVRRQHRQHREDHPLGAVAGLAERLDHVQPLGGLLAPLAGGRGDLLAQLGRQLIQVNVAQQLLHGLRAHARLEDLRQVGVGVAQVVLEVLQLAVALLLHQIKPLQPFQIAPAGLGLGADLIAERDELILNGGDLALGVHARALALALSLRARLLRLFARRLHDQVAVLLGDAIQRRHVLRVHDLALGRDLLAGRRVDGIVHEHLAHVFFEEPAQLGLGGARLLELVGALDVDLVNGLRDAALDPLDLLIAALLGVLNLRRDLLLALLDARLHALFDAGERLSARLLIHPRDDVEGEVQDALQVARREVEQQADTAGRALEIPDMADGRGELDVAHALAPYLGTGDLHAALVADDALEAHTLVLAAVALPVLRRTEDALAEQAVLLGLKRAVVDRLRLGDLAVAPRADLLRAGETDADGVEIVYFEHWGRRPASRAIAKRGARRLSPFRMPCRRCHRGTT